VRAIFPEGVDCALEIVGSATIKDTLNTIRSFGQLCKVYEFDQIREAHQTMEKNKIQGKAVVII